jgi:hypothetical protein
MRRGILLIALTAVLTGRAAAFDFEPGNPIDVPKLDAEQQADIYGTWEIRDKSGKRRCRITFLKDFTIGGYQLEKAPGCEKAFAVMDDISAWRLLEGWTVDLVDPLRKIRVRFETPDNRYVPFGDPKDIVGMDELLRIKAKPDKK